VKHLGSGFAAAFILILWLVENALNFGLFDFIIGVRKNIFAYGPSFQLEVEQAFRVLVASLTYIWNECGGAAMQHIIVINF
jgi:hypothetical protein